MNITDILCFFASASCILNNLVRGKPLIIPYMYVCTLYVQVHLKKIEYHEKSQKYVSLISESETHIL